MWCIRSQEVEPARCIHYSVEKDGQPASVSAVLRGWRVDEEWRSLFCRTLRESDFSAFRWETPPVSAATLTRPFEFVLLNSPGLDRRADPVAFAAHFGADEGVAVFPNLGGDAVLVVPTPEGDATAYSHLAAFVRRAPEWQQHALWQAVGGAMTDRVRSRLVWLSTAGAGVPWLHVRLDDRPKYYGYGPYTAPR